MNSKFYIDVDKLTPEYRQKLYQYQEDKIQQLEKENAELKISIDKIKNETFECDTCLDVCYQNEKLEKENTDLKKTIEGFRKGYADLNDYSDKLKSQLSNIKYLNRQEVEKIVIDFIGDSGLCSEMVTAICNLALPEVRTSPFTNEQNEAIGGSNVF